MVRQVEKIENVNKGDTVQPFAVMKPKQTAITFLMLLITLTCSSASSAQVHRSSAPRSATGKMRIWVPAGAIGDAYWIYVDGKLVNAPPRQGASLGNAFQASGSANGDNSRIWGPGALSLAMKHGDFSMPSDQYDGESLEKYLSAAGYQFSGGCRLAPGHSCPLSWDMRNITPPAGPHVFEAFDFSRDPGQYKVQVAINTRPLSGSSFPFVLSKEAAVPVVSGETTNLFVGIPDGWSQSAFDPIAAQSPCNYGTPKPPDFNDALARVRQYMSNPMVKALRNALSAPVSSGGRTLTLNLPPDLGGSRELNGDQVLLIANSTANHTDMPSLESLAQCREWFPQYELSYTGYSKDVKLVQDEIQRFRELAEKLGTTSVSTH